MASETIARGVTLEAYRHGDDEGKVIDFVEAFGKGLEMGIEATILAGALAQCDNELERAVASVM